MLESRVEHPKTGVSVLRLKGRLVFGDELQSFKAEIAALLEQAASVVILDLSQVDYVDSSGIGSLLYLDGKARDAGSTLRIAGITRRVQEVLHMTHTDKILTIDPDAGTSVELSGL
jgi:anti-sigma B factor antagonist